MNDNKKIKIRDVDFIAIDMYIKDKKSLSQISKILHIDINRLSSLLKQLDIEIDKRRNCTSIKKYNVNSNYFNIIDTSEKAYWLGFLYADGYNSTTYIQLGISSIDINHLRKYRKSLNSTHPISNKKNDNTVNITISDKQITKDLTKLGCINNKTYKGKFPNYNQIPQIYMRDFIRGFFDGDGCIHKLITKKEIGLIQ